MKHRLLHTFTREEIQAAFDNAKSRQHAYLTVEELKNAIGYLNLHMPNRRVLESKRAAPAVLDAHPRSRSYQ